jgi:hypothetical protein
MPGLTWQTLAAQEFLMPKIQRRAPRRNNPKRVGKPKRGKGLRGQRNVATRAEQQVQISFRARQSVYRQLIILVARKGCTIQTCILSALRREGLKLTARDIVDRRRSR